MSTKLTGSAAIVAAYLAKLEGYYIPKIQSAKTLEELKETMAFYVLEGYQSELTLSAYNLAGGPKATREQRLEAAEAIKVRIAELRAAREEEQRREEIKAKVAKHNEAAGA